nr:hypothetical protein [Burkholderiaceae bacterium]
MNRFRRGLFCAMAAWALLGCNKAESPASGIQPPPGVSAGAPVETPAFKVLATSDLKDAQPLEGMVEKATGVKLRFTFGGTMEST